MKHSTSTEAKKTGETALDVRRIRGLLLLRGQTLTGWALARGHRRGSVHNALSGLRSGAQSRRIAAELRAELNISRKD